LNENLLLNPAVLFAEQMADVAVYAFSLNFYVWNILIGCCVQHIQTWFLPLLGKKEHMYFWNTTVKRAYGEKTKPLKPMKLNHSYAYQTVLSVNNYPYLITGYVVTKNARKRFFFCLLACMSNNRIYSPEVNIIHFLPVEAVFWNENISSVLYLFMLPFHVFLEVWQKASRKIHH